MRNTLFFKFLMTALLAIVLAFFVVSTLGSSLTYRHFLKQNRQTLYEEANTIASSYAASYYNGEISETLLTAQLQTVAVYLQCDVILLSSDGTVFVDTGHHNIDKIEAFDPTDYGTSNYGLDTFYDVYEDTQLVVYYPVVYNFLVRGYIILCKPAAVVAADANAVFNYNYLTMVICFVLMALMIPVLLFSIIRPLNKITETAAHYAKGDYSKRIGLHQNDEIGRLADSLDYMASEINNLNEYQRKFIANVSHDFRSPLTSIKGYLEAILDGTIPSEMQEKYLNIVLTETERLTKLTNNLLTINNVTERGMVLDPSDFDIIALIKQTIETFEGTCARKHIKFKLIFSDTSLMVTADQTKIEQVIYNLVDNAIKFSNNDSSIIISANTKNDKIMVSVKDFGIGIPKDSMNKIWERFYKTDASRGKDKKGTGLGLSIVKEIITAHQEYIDVISTEGVGTEFIFALPRSKTAPVPVKGSWFTEPL